MNIDRKQIESIVEQVLKEVLKKSDLEINKNNINNGLENDIDKLIERGKKAYLEFKNFTLNQREELINNIRQYSFDHARELAELAVKETGFGKVEDKYKKNLLAIEKTPAMEGLSPTAFSGDNGLTLLERAPYGIIASITPSTNPAATIINNAIGMVAAGNVVIFNAHPKAKMVSNKTCDILRQALRDSGFPEDIILYVPEPSIETSKQLMNHKDVNLLVVTGGESVVKTAMKTGKKVIAAGPGNPPVVVDETADIIKAAHDIVRGASFDNNIMCMAEKEVFVVSSVLDVLKRHMKEFGAYELTVQQADKIADIIFDEKIINGKKVYIINRKFVGKDPYILAKAIGLDISKDTKLLICEVDKNHKLVVNEQLTPILPLVRVKDVDEAINEAVKVEAGNHHTAMMYSKNIENLDKMAKLIDTAIFVKNGPSFAGLGFEGEGYTTLTIGTSTGEGVTYSYHFTRERRCVLVDYFRIV